MVKRRITINLLILLLLLGALALIGTRSSSAATDISTLAWMAGNWTGTINGVETEELWLAPKANSMIAVHRDVKEQRTISFEFLRIEATADAITYWASPKGKPAVPFKM